MESERWSASLSSHVAIANHVYSLPSPMVMFNLTSQSAVNVARYHIAGVQASDPIEAQTLKLGPCQIDRVDAEKFWRPASNDDLFSLDSKPDASKWLTIFGPQRASYFHAFARESGDYLYSAYTSHVGASLHYACELLKEYSMDTQQRHGQQSASTTGIAKVAGMLGSLDRTPSTGKWHLAQALAGFAPDQAAEILRELAAGKNGIGVRARKTLDRLLEKPHA